MLAAYRTDFCLEIDVSPWPASVVVPEILFGIVCLRRAYAACLRCGYYSLQEPDFRLITESSLWVQVIDGLDWLSKNYRPPAVAVLALGGDAQYALDQAAHNLVRAGVPVVVAAGNDGVDACTKSPARSVMPPPPPPHFLSLFNHFRDTALTEM